MRGEGIADSASVSVCSEEDVIASEKSLPYVTVIVGAIVAGVSDVVDK